MQLKIKLSEIVNGMDFGGDEFGYLNKKTGKIILVNDEDLSAAKNNKSLDDFPDWQQEAIKELKDFLKDENEYLPLPTRHDIHIHDIMQDFCRSLPNREITPRLLHVINVRGAFRMFKDLCSEYGFIEEWYRYRDRAFKKIAVDWCADNKIEFIDDVLIPDEEQIKTENKRKQYAELEVTIRELIKGESDLIANAANTAALIYHTLPDINWAGFYFLKGDELVLGPFQGKPACVRIPLGKGVCGTAAKERKTLVIPDVHQFPGHIACDSVSNSEIVIPLIKNNKLLGVLDIDSPALGRFDEEDQKGLERLAGIFVDKTDHFWCK